MDGTRALLEARVGRDIAGCVVQCFTSSDRDPIEVARCGEHEACALTDDAEACLRGACEGGHLALANLMIAKGANEWNQALVTACRGGNLALANLMIEKGAHNWSRGLHEACEAGHLALANLLIAKGANDWNGGLQLACRCGNNALAKLMVASGATQCFHCGSLPH